MMIRNFIQEPTRLVLTNFARPNFRKLMFGLVAGIALSVSAPVSQAQNGLDVTQIQQQKLCQLQVTDLADYPIGQERLGTLRQVLASAKPASTIVFSRPGTIHLTRPLDIAIDGLTIDGTSNPVVIIGDVVRIRSSSQSDLKLGVIDAWQSYDSVLMRSGPHPGIQDRLSLMVVEQIAKRTGDILDYTHTKANIEARTGLGYVPTFEEITQKENRRNYQFRIDGKRSLSSAFKEANPTLR
jgi:hypothetical protein